MNRSQAPSRRRLIMATLVTLLSLASACGDDDGPGTATTRAGGDGDAATTVAGETDDGGNSGADAGTGEPQVIDAQLDFDGTERLYRLYVPSSFGAEGPVALVIVMHGNGTDRNTFAEKSGFDATAEREGFLVVYPDALEGVWNGGFSNRTKDIDDVGFLTELVGELASQYPIDTERVFATGLSGGGMMSYRLACEAPELVAAIAPVGATMVVQCDPAAPVSLLHIHGVQDQSIPLEGREDREFPPVADVVETWSGLDGCTGAPAVSTDGAATITSWSECDRGTTVEFYAVDGVGHEYPRGDLGAPLDAREVVWTFFTEHPRTS